MPCYLSTNLKRKELEFDHLDNDDVLDFTLSSPARKIRRLDADLPPVIEIEEPDRPLRFEQQHRFSGSRSSDAGESRLRGLVIEELPPENEERSIVLFKPIDTPLYRSPYHFVVDSDLISSIKDQAVRELNSKSSRSVEEEESRADEQLAVIPWVPSQQSHEVLPSEVSEMEVSEPMDAEEEVATMEAEEENIASPGVQSTKGLNQPNWSSENVLHQYWQQQHCKVPQPPHNTATPIVWYR